MMKAVVIALSMLAVTACSAMMTRWEHAEIPFEEWRVDGAQCKHQARRMAEREFEETAKAESNIYDGSELTIDTMMSGSRITKRIRTLFADCMLGLGYTPVE